MMDLVLHIGLSKTGTTTLQQHVLPVAPGYLGREDRLGTRNRDGGLYKMFLASHRGLPVDLEAWRQRVLHCFKPEEQHPVVLSEENLAHWEHDGSYCYPITGRLSDLGRAPRSGVHPIATFVERLLVPAWRDLGQVRVLVTLRNQFDWLGSRYAQSSNRILQASQADFERQVRWIVEREDAYLDYAGLVEALGAAVGSSNVTVLLMEDMKTAEYWETLARVVGDGHIVPPPSEARANRRATEEGWQMRSFRHDRFMKSVLFGQQRTPQTSRKWTLRALRHPRHVLQALTQRRSSEIRANSELRIAVQQCYEPSNRRLATMIGRDLGALGYW